jgi:multiple sugar transport system substrate-binding protein
MGAGATFTREQEEAVMPRRALKAALVAGGMYDHLYKQLPAFERVSGVQVEVGFRGTHPELNAHLAQFTEAPYDLVSTHTKYAPSQRHLLAPLEGFDTTDFFPALLELASINGALYGIPRNIDLRLLHYRTDLVAEPPRTWDALVDLAQRLTREPERYGFVFTGMESGLFGTFFELAEAGGARIFSESLEPELANQGGRWALEILRKLYRSGAVPAALTAWQYDEVHGFFRDGRAAMVCDWPGYYGSYREPSSAVRDCFAVTRMPAGPSGRVCCYAGSHTFALTRAGAGREEARELLRFLTAPEQQALEARQGSVPVRRSAMEAERRAATGAGADRLALLESAIGRDLIVPPKLAQYPRIEEILWRTVQAAMTGQLEIAHALETMERRIGELLREGR